VQFDCPDSDCSVTVTPEGGEPFTLRACHEEGHGVYRALKLDASRKVRQALARGAVTVAVPILDKSSGEIQVGFRFEGPFAHIPAVDRSDVCDGDFYGDAR